MPINYNRVCLALAAIHSLVVGAMVAYSPTHLPVGNSYQVVLDPGMMAAEVQAAQDALQQWTNTTSVGFFPAPCQAKVICLSSSHPHPEQLPELNLQQSYFYQLGQAMGVSGELPDSVVSPADLTQWQVAEWHRMRR